MVGVETGILQSMLNAKTGLVARHVAYGAPPSIAEVNQWIERAQEPKRSRIGWYLDEISRLEQPPAPVIPQDQRDAQIARAKEAARLIKETGRRMQLTPSLMPPKQEHNPTELLASLDNLDALRGA